MGACKRMRSVSTAGQVEERSSEELLVDHCQRAALTHELELEHRENIHKTNMISRDEEARLLQVKLLAMRDEVAALVDKVSQKDKTIAALNEKSENLRAELANSKKEARAQEARMKKRDAELATLQAEVDSLNGSVQDSSKAMQEKFALTRKLERLRPEMEHFKSQLAKYQAMVAENNDLRRQLDSLEVELDNVKRWRQRAQVKEDNAAMGALKSRLDKAEKKLAADVKERERARAELERELSQALGERLEERIESLKAKYKASQGELKETRNRLDSCQEELKAVKKTAICDAKELDVKKSITMEPGLKRKRRVQEMSYDNMTIQTPGNEDMVSKRPAVKKHGVEQAMVGEKSTFSITPFLKRAKSLSYESLEEALEHETLDSTFSDREDGNGAPEPLAEAKAEDDDAIAAAKREVPMQASPVAADPETASRPRTKGLAEAPPASTNKMVAKAERTKPCATMGTVTEVPVAEEQENAAAAKGPDADGKKRRKLLGTASQGLLGEDDDGETTAAKAPAKPVLAPGKKPRFQLGGMRSAFAGAAFSPLKRDRRGVNASFLA